MKKFLNIILVITLIITVSLSMVYASEDEIKVMVNGEYVEFDVEPQLINDRTMVPFRAIFEAMGATVEWNHDLWQAIGEKDGKKVSMIIGSDEVVVTENGEERTIKIDQAPIIVDGRTLVPVRFVAEAFDKIVAWDGYEQTVIILDLQGFAEKMEQKAPNFYEYVSTLNAIPNNFKQTDDFEFIVEGNESGYSQNIGVSFIGTIETIVNENDAQFDLDMEYTLFERFKESPKKEKENINLNMSIQDNKLLINTNLFEITGNDKEVVNGKEYSIKNNGLLLDIEEAGIPGVSNFEELKSFINLMLTDLDKASNYINNAISNEDMYIYVEDVEEMVAVYDMILGFVSDKNFAKKELSTQTVYTLTIDKKAIVDAIKNMYLDGMISDEYILEELAMYKNIDMSIKFYVKNDITKNVTLDFNANAEIDDVEGSIKLKWEENKSDVNDGQIKITHPDYEQGIKMSEVSYESFREQLPIVFEMYQEEVTAEINENIQNGKDKFDGITKVTEDTFPTDGYVLNGNVLVSYYGSGVWGIDKNGILYYAPGYYLEDENITVYNNEYYVEGKAEDSLDVMEYIHQAIFLNTFESILDTFDEIVVVF